MPHANTADSTDLSRFLGRAGFRRYRAEMVAAAASYLQLHKAGEFDEQALPAYTHPNLLMRWLFWQRIWRVVKYIDRTLPAGSSVLDFGCGMGTVLPLFAARGHHVTGVDLDLRLAPGFLEKMGIPGTPLVHADDLDRIPAGSMDLITALDVLEHVDDLEGCIDRLARLLKPGGRFLICGPSESLLYKMGRWLAGFSGDYHVRNIADIRTAFARTRTVRPIARLFPVVTFFEIFAA